MDEIRAMKNNHEHPNNYDDMPLMDSFLKETARLNPNVIGTSIPTPKAPGG
jgi:hypothetical protein